MEKRVSYYINRRNPLLWLSVLLLLGSLGCRIAYVCAGKDADPATIWQLILFGAAVVLYGLLLVFSSRERIYRTAIPVVMLGVYYGLQISASVQTVWMAAMSWVLALVAVVLYANALDGRSRGRWTLSLVLAAMAGSALYLNRLTLRRWILPDSLSACSDAALFFALLLVTVSLRPYLDGKYHPVWGDRNDGRRLRTLSPFSRVEGYIMPNRTGASNVMTIPVEVTELERFVHLKRRQGFVNLGMLHVFLAAYVRCVALYPALNRFMSGQHVYSRDEDIQFNMIVKKDMTIEAPDTAIKLHLHPADTVEDIYRKMDVAVQEVKSGGEDSDFEKLAHLLNLIPGLLLKFTVWLLKIADYFGLIPKMLTELSPFHGSIFFTAMGSLGVPPVIHHLYDFGNLPVFCAVGCKRRVTELDPHGVPVQKKYVDVIFNTDERTVDGFYYAKVLKTFSRLLQHPDRLEVPPETVLKDID